MKWLPISLAFALVLGATVITLPQKWKTDLPAPVAIAQPAQAPKYAADFADAFCRWDAQYLSDHGAGKLDVSPEVIARSEGAYFDTCHGVRYLGSLSPNASGDARDVFVLHITDGAGTHDEVWVFAFNAEGKAVHFDYAD